MTKINVAQMECVGHWAAGRDEDQVDQSLFIDNGYNSQE